ncbi:hypothetical protein [Pseudomonas aeruginosa]|uniref:hypothetical protein n=1 Tax=Pseudomonas aeruginosa TaxID=287 RepID=UPI001571A8FC|nr:hypothetical protein [Pseudomonas aeruginosa]MCV4033832.1 hypothetical protein [Pseudomonas aeruginosa]NTT47222.1 hypothetical protein [Pseudomonas aeruginosa]
MANDEMLESLERDRSDKRRVTQVYADLGKKELELRDQIRYQQQLLDKQEQENKNYRAKLERRERELVSSLEKRDAELQARFQNQKERFEQKERELLDYYKNREKDLVQELSTREAEFFERAKKHQEQLDTQERDLRDFQKRFESEFKKREKDLIGEVRERERILEDREKDLLEKQSSVDKYIFDRTKSFEEMYASRVAAISEQEELLKRSQEDLEQEKERYKEENLKEIERKSQSYVNGALSGLESKEVDFHLISKIWSGLGALSIFLGILVVAVSSYLAADGFHSSSNTGWSYFVYVTFRGLVMVALFVALARYCFLYSNSYMHESLKSGERRHAINFGKFYLEVFGAQANWDQVKDAFQHWNINNNSAFSKRSSDEFDPAVIDKIYELAKSLGTLKGDGLSPKGESKVSD